MCCSVPEDDKKVFIIFHQLYKPCLTVALSHTTVNVCVCVLIKGQQWRHQSSRKWSGLAAVVKRHTTSRSKKTHTHTHNSLSVRQWQNIMPLPSACNPGNTGTSPHPVPRLTPASPFSLTHPAPPPPTGSFTLCPAARQVHPPHTLLPSELLIRTGAPGG